MTTANEIMNELRQPPANELPPHRSPPLAGQGGEEHGIRLTAEQLRARRARSIAIALALGAFVLVIFAVTIVRLGSRAIGGPDYMRPVQADQ
jgi:hypothetical protein